MAKTMSESRKRKHASRDSGTGMFMMARQARPATRVTERIVSAGGFSYKVKRGKAPAMKPGILVRLAGALALSQTDTLTLLQIAPATLKRRREAGALQTAESDRVLRFARLLELATALMGGNENAARTWLKTPAPSLGDDTPLQRATTEFGAREVEDLIGRLRHGVFT
jgi:putative toxin-antitoxin system antitoxin component (TIGR02293 family)